MRIVSLTFANINSLGGEWSIDFGNPAFGDGLFALTGPTGSGKTSVLDAISLALFGRTVRQSSINKEFNEVMTRGSGSAFAEVVFESGARRYAARWEQRRARGSARGALQAAQRSLAALPGGETIHEGLRGMDEAVRTVLGMDFGQFTRAVLLAQGEFDAFLKADEGDRSAILEQVTGTDIYSRIGAAVFARFQQERDKTREIEIGRQVVQILADEQRTTLEAELARLGAEKTALAAAVQTLSAQNEWLQKLGELRRQRATLEKEQERLASDKIEAEPELALLIRSEAAHAFDLKVSVLENRRAAALKSRVEVVRREDSLKELSNTLENLAPRIATAQDAVSASQETLETRLPVLQQARALDGGIKTAETALEGANRTADAARFRLDGATEQLKTLRKAAAADRAALEAADLLRQGHPGPSTVADTPLLQAIRKLEKATAIMESSRARLDEVRKLRKAARATRDTAATERDQRRPDLLEALVTARDAELLAYAVAGLDEQRHRLEDGRPCPLCGATEHPYADGNLPGTDETRQRRGQFEAAIEQLDEQLRQAGKDLEQVEQTLTTLEGDFERQKEMCIAARSAVDKAEATVTTRLEESNKRLENLERQRETLSGEAATAAEERDVREKELGGLREKRAALFPGNPEAEENRLRTAREAAGKELQNLATRHDRLATCIESARSELDEAIRRRDKDAEEERAGSASLAKDWIAGGFADESEWRAALQTDDFIARTGKLRLELAERAADLQGRLRQNVTDLTAEEAKALTELSPEGAGAELARCQAVVEACQTALGDLGRQLKVDDENRRRRAEQGDALERQKVIAAKWRNLNAWAGGADGEQFKRYAQGITLRRLLQLSNPHVTRMTRGRYELFWDSASRALLPDIIDREQGDARRAVSNLSGGETFMVSLALALGLSAMSSERLRVDTLFLDEGFGTLDDDALSTALDTLGDLRQEGKLIGVISHVQAVKERIATQIRVTPQPGGRSTLAGPGVVPSSAAAVAARESDQ